MSLSKYQAIDRLKSTLKKDRQDTGRPLESAQKPEDAKEDQKTKLNLEQERAITIEEWIQKGNIQEHTELKQGSLFLDPAEQKIYEVWYILEKSLMAAPLVKGTADKSLLTNYPRASKSKLQPLTAKETEALQALQTETKEVL